MYAVISYITLRGEAEYAFNVKALHDAKEIPLLSFDGIHRLNKFRTYTI